MKLLVRWALVVVAGCGAAPPEPSRPVVTSGSSGGSASAPGVPVVVPGAVAATTDDLALVLVSRATLDVDRRRLFVQRSSGIDVLELGSGKGVGRVDLGWDGELWPAGKLLLAFHQPGPLAIEATLVDHVAAKPIASCTQAVAAPAGAQLQRIDVFTTRGRTFFKWESAPPPEHHGGARMSDAQMAAWQQRFQAAYACGLLVMRVTTAGCQLEPATVQDAGLDHCETRQMPFPRGMPAVVGDLQLAVDTDEHGTKTGAHETVHTLVVRGTTGGERWRVELERAVQEPPAP